MRWNILLITFTFPGYFMHLVSKAWIKQHCHWLKVSFWDWSFRYFRSDLEWACRSFPYSFFGLSIFLLKRKYSLSRHKVCLFLSNNLNLAAHYPVLFGRKMLVQTNVKSSLLVSAQGKVRGFMRMTMTSTCQGLYMFEFPAECSFFQKVLLNLCLCF